MNERSCSAAYVWHRILSNLEEHLGRSLVSTWLGQAEAVAFDGNCLILKEESDFRRSQIAHRFPGMIRDAAREEMGIDIQILLQAG